MDELVEGQPLVHLHRQDLHFRGRPPCMPTMYMSIPPGRQMPRVAAIDPLMPHNFSPTKTASLVAFSPDLPQCAKWCVPDPRPRTENSQRRDPSKQYLDIHPRLRFVAVDLRILPLFDGKARHSGLYFEQDIPQDRSSGHGSCPVAAATALLPVTKVPMTSQNSESDRRSAAMRSLVRNVLWSSKRQFFTHLSDQQR